MADLLELARESYRLRDDDNVYLGRIEAQLVAAVREAEKRVGGDPVAAAKAGDVAELIHVLEDPAIASKTERARGPDDAPTSLSIGLRARQLVGQPASPGLAVGPARVIRDPSELLSFREGDILVCDALDPTMTFVTPLAAAVVERRGGMLIHGAIIAREYGIPCVTGIPESTRWIRMGDTITVDGHVGLVTVNTSDL